MTQRLIGKIENGGDSVEVYIIKDDQWGGPEELFLRVRTPDVSMTMGLNARSIIYLSNLEPPMGG